MKHILNNLTEEEKNAIREQHTGGMKVMNENFSKLVNTKLGDVKPMINEQNEENLSKTQKTILRLIEKGEIIKASRWLGGKELAKGYYKVSEIMQGIDWHTDENLIINISKIIENNLDGEINIGDIGNDMIINDDGVVEKIVVLLTEGVVVEVYPEDFDEDSHDYSSVTIYELPWEEVPSDIIFDIFYALIRLVIRRR